MPDLYDHSKFILTAPVRHYTYTQQKRTSSIVRVSFEAYHLAIKMAEDSGLPLTTVISKAVEYAFKNLEYELVDTVGGES